MPRAAGVQIVQEYGLISATFTRIKASATFSLAKWASDNAVEAESARAMALGKLRTKAKAAGANAVLGVKVDLETEEWGRGGGGMTTMMASGTAVLLAGDMGKVVLPADSRHCLCAPPKTPLLHRPPAHATTPAARLSSSSPYALHSRPASTVALLQIRVSTSSLLWLPRPRGYQSSGCDGHA